jgi:hypothetical protein
MSIFLHKTKKGEKVTLQGRSKMKNTIVIKWLLGIAAVFTVTAGNVVAFPVDGESENIFQHLQSLITTWDSVNISEPGIMLICGTCLVGLSGFIRRRKDLV